MIDTNPMNPEIKAEWLRRLRSGEYEQGQERLITLDQEAGEQRFCCLGVLCEIAVDAGIIERIEGPLGELDHGYDDVEGALVGVTYGVPDQVRTFDGGVLRMDDQMVSYTVLPEPVKLWAGLDEQNPTIENGYHGTLAEKNDAGASFTEIADLIEEHL